MPTPLRALVAATALATPLLLTTQPASAVPSCPAGSTNVYTGEAVVGGPVSIRLHQGTTTLCVESHAADVSVTTDGGVQVWRNGGSLLDAALCLRERVDYAIDESQSDAWYECHQDPHRVV